MRPSLSICLYPDCTRAPQSRLCGSSHAVVARVRTCGPLMRRGCMEEPGQFEHRPFRADHAVALLSRPYPQAKVQAADLGLFALMTFRLAEPRVLSDLADPAGLCYVRIAGGELRIGSLTRHADLLSSAVVGEHFAILRDAGRAIASREIRCSETIGGMLCQADPAEDMAAVFAAARASLERAGEFAAGHCECAADLRYPARAPQCLAGHLASRALGRALLRARG